MKIGEYVFFGWCLCDLLLNMVMFVLFKCMGCSDLIVYGFCLIFCDWVVECMDYFGEFVEMVLVYIVSDKIEVVYCCGMMKEKWCWFMLDWVYYCELCLVVVI